MINKFFLVPSLRRLGLRSGFCVRNPAYVAAATAAALSMREKNGWSLQVQAFRAGQQVKRVELTVGDRETFVQSFDDSWNFSEESGDGDDLYVVRYIPSQVSDAAQRFLTSDLEGQMFFSAPNHGWYASVINGFIPDRPSGHKFAPIFHSGHYFLTDARFMTYLCLVNYNADKEGAPVNKGENSMEFKLRSDSGKTLGTVTKAIKYNTTFLASVSELLAEAGVEGLSQEHVNVYVRGGSSQYAIYTVFHNIQAGTIGVEHSLAPHYYTDAVKTPAARAILNRNVFGAS